MKIREFDARFHRAFGLKAAFCERIVAVFGLGDLDRGYRFVERHGWVFMRQIHQVCGQDVASFYRHAVGRAAASVPELAEVAGDMPTRALEAALATYVSRK